MTRASGVHILEAPCCGARYAFPRYTSINFSAFEYWTDGWREWSLMPNDEGLRHCQCGKFIRVAEMLKVETAEDSDLPSMEHVKSALLPQCIAQAANEEVEVAARRSYWHHLNNAYRDIYRKHRDAEDAQTEAQWHSQHPDTRNWWDKLWGHKSPEYKKPANSPFTYPAFQPTSEQMLNMNRLTEILHRRHQTGQQGYELELAELYREQGRPEEALQIIETANEEEKNSVTFRLIKKLIHQKDTAPMRYRM